MADNLPLPKNSQNDPGASSRNSLVFSPTTTLAPEDAYAQESKMLPKTETVSSWQSASPKPTPLALDSTDSGNDVPISAKLSQRKKWSLLVVFSLGMFIDIWMYSAFFIFTGPISLDLQIPFEQQVWVICSYAITFSAFQLFWGRVSDLYSAKPVFVFGFLSLGLLSLIISFLPERYSFFVIRALSGIAGATLIPAAFRLIVAVFEPHELGKAFTVFGLSGAIANSTGVLAAGLIEYIPPHGQSSPWRWFFRIVAVIIIPVALGASRWVPKPTGKEADAKNKIKRMDFIGITIMLFALVLLIVGLTLGASYGWKKATFLAPFLISIFLFPAFFIWEYRLPTEYAVLPPAIWKTKNLTVLIVLSLLPYSWWSSNFLVFIEYFVRLHGEKPIIAALRVLPEAGSASLITILLLFYPTLVSRARIPVTISMLLAAVAYVLWSQAPGFIGRHYWAYLFPGMLLGSGGMIAIFNAINVGIMTAVDPESAGVAGALLQVALQLGGIVGLSIQAGLLTINPGGLANQTNIQTSYYFVLGWIVLWLIGFLAFYRQPPKGGAVSVLAA